MAAKLRAHGPERIKTIELIPGSGGVFEVVVDGTLVHVSSWYDNEMGYSARCVDLIRYIGERL